MKNVAILLTVFNRKNVTLLGLHSVNKAISKLRGDYQFDIYMTDDGCTDGTSLAVQLEFPNVKIIDCDGTLFWSRGMCAAWEAAISSGIGYDYFLWFNDDVELYANAFQIVFQDSISENDSAIISGAFCNHNNEVSYGGRIGNNLVQPNGKIQEIELMNGNFVLIPRTVYEIVGQIDKRYHHGEGDFDYGCRARKLGIRVVLSHAYVGIAERHDSLIPVFCTKDKKLKERWILLHAPYNSLMDHYRFNVKWRGHIYANLILAECYLGVLFPVLYIKLKTTILS
jgi:GT2 family glycosyltransferase